MKYLNSKFIPALMLAFSISIMPINAKADSITFAKGLLAIVVIAGGAYALNAMTNGSEEADSPNNEDDPGRSAFAHEEERRAQQAAEANRVDEPTPYYPGAVGVYSTGQGY